MAAYWTAIILAGQRPGIDPLAEHFNMKWKALIPVGGQAMLSHVVRTLRQCPEIGRIVILAQDPAAMADAATDGGGVDAIVMSENSISNSLAAVLGQAEAPWPVLVTTADHPLLSPEMIAQFLNEAAGADIAIAMVEKTTMMKEFPKNRRTWLKFSDGYWSGANLFAMRTERIIPALNLWAKAEQDRKVPVKLFRHFGLWLMFRAITRTIGLADGLIKAGRRLGLSAKLVPMRDPIAAIDVDKPADHELAEHILSARSLASSQNMD